MEKQGGAVARVTAGVLTCGAMLVIGWGLGHFIKFGEEAKAVSEKRAVPVVLRAVTNDVWNPVEAYVGHVEPTLSVDVLPQVEGYVTKVHFREGAMVREGEVLYTIDDERYAATLRLREAQLKEAEADRDRTQRYLTRLESSDKRGITQSDLDTAVSEAAAAKAKVEECKASIGLARYDVKHTKIYAPIGGIIGKSAVYPGDFVASSKGALAHIVQSDPIRVSFPMPDRDYYALRRATKDVSGGFDERRVRLRLPDGTMYECEGAWDFRDNQIDASTATLSIRLSFRNPKNVLIPNTYVTVETDGRRPARRLQIAERALVDLPGGGTGVWIVDAKTMTAHLAKIEVLGMYHATLAVRGAIRNGDLFVYEGKQKLYEGAAVKRAEVE